MNDVETRLQQLERVLEFSRELTSTVSLEPLLHKIVEAAAELTDSEMATILLLDDRTGELRFIASSILADQFTDVPVPIEGSIAGVAFSSGSPLIVPDVRADPRYYPVVEQRIGSASTLTMWPVCAGCSGPASLWLSPTWSAMRNGSTPGLSMSGLSLMLALLSVSGIRSSVS
jgi:transcriptional regulator with GAF, ATPase, and Fis domain